MPLNDQSPMPWGKHKGEKMEDVPAFYLHWVWAQKTPERRTGEVCDYIRENLPALEKEYPNGIWT